MSFCTSFTWEAISSTVAQAFTSGGSSSRVWGFVASAIGAFLIVLCVAEYASMIPTAGGQYHYVAELSPLKYRRVFSWYAGWITMMALVLNAASGTFATAMQIQSWTILFNDNYIYERWHTSVVSLPWRGKNSRRPVNSINLLDCYRVKYFFHPFRNF